jgi:hypothetical protein
MSTVALRLVLTQSSPALRVLLLYERHICLVRIRDRLFDSVFAMSLRAWSLMSRSFRFASALIVCSSNEKFMTPMTGAPHLPAPNASSVLNLRGTQKSPKAGGHSFLFQHHQRREDAREPEAQDRQNRAMSYWICSIVASQRASLPLMPLPFPVNV